MVTSDLHSHDAEVVLRGGIAGEDWTSDARFHEYSAAVDPEAVGAISAVPIRRFEADRHRNASSGLHLFDLSSVLVTEAASTTPGLLAGFVVLEPSATVVTPGGASSELYYCLEGSGRCERHEVMIEWHAGDFVVLPAGGDVHHVGGAQRSLLYRVTDEPLLRYLGATATHPRFSPTRFDGVQARARLAEVASHPDAALRSRISVLLGNTATPQTLTVTHTLWAMLGTLPKGSVQRPHRHQSAAVDLITECAPGCYSLLGHALDATGAIIDPIRVEWESQGVFVTPPGVWHSHHNESDRDAELIPIQDAGLHTYLRSLDIRFSPAPVTPTPG